MANLAFDRIDDAILRELQNNGRLSNKELAAKVAPLTNNHQTWVGLEEYLKELLDLTNKGLATAQLESELRQLQGRAVLLATLLNLKNDVEKVMKSK